MSDFRVISGGESSPSLGAAYILDLPVVSFNSFAKWKVDTISLNIDSMNQETTEVETNTCKVKNLSTEGHIVTHLALVLSERLKSKKYFKSLKQEGNESFPNIVFCSSVIKDFKNLDISESLQNKINYALTKLNSVIENSTSTSDLISSTGLEISGESDTTKNSSKLMAFRRKKLPNGDYFYFDLHVKNFPDSKRLYFHPCFSDRKIHIGYFGNHLPC